MKNTEKPSILEKKLKTTDPHIQKYVRELEKLIANLETENARMKADNIRLNVRVKALEAELKKYKPRTPEEEEQIRRMAADLLKDLPPEKLGKELLATLQASNKSQG